MLCLHGGVVILYCLLRGSKLLCGQVHSYPLLFFPLPSHTHTHTHTHLLDGDQQLAAIKINTAEDLNPHPPMPRPQSTSECPTAVATVPQLQPTMGFLSSVTPQSTTFNLQALVGPTPQEGRLLPYRPAVIHNTPPSVVPSAGGGSGERSHSIPSCPRPSLSHPITLQHLYATQNGFVAHGNMHGSVAANLSLPQAEDTTTLPRMASTDSDITGQPEEISTKQIAKKQRHVAREQGHGAHVTREREHVAREREHVAREQEHVARERALKVCGDFVHASCELLERGIKN